MLSDEEKKAIEKIKSFNQYNWEMNNLKEKEFAKPYFDALDTILNLIEKQSKEIEDRKKYAEEYIHNNRWLYKQLNENYILRVESEQKERKAWIKGTNDADELCNKKWEDKIKAKIKECEKEKNIPEEMDFKAFYRIKDLKNIEIKVLESLLKE